jgi:hypothetical protein
VKRGVTSGPEEVAALIYLKLFKRYSWTHTAFDKKNWECDSMSGSNYGFTTCVQDINNRRTRRLQKGLHPA